MVVKKGVSQDMLMMDPLDNIAVCLRDFKADEKVSLRMGPKTIHVKVQDQIPRGHKVCVKEIQNGAQVIKYGEVIGKASTEIHIGQHVHVHNVVD